MISVKNIRVTFNPGTILQTKALRNISLDIEEGDFVTVIGSNGAGKSTLLGAIAGSVPVSSGKIVIGNTDVSTLPAHQRAPFVAQVFQDPLAGTCANLTIEENMALALARGRRRSLRVAINGKRRDYFRQRLSVLKLNLENRLQDPVGKLSGGQRQALSLIMATLGESRILLLDEHTAALDPRMSKFILELTGRVCVEYHLTVLMITHSMQSALLMGSRLVMLHQGKIIHDAAGAEREKLTVADLLQLFSQATSDLRDTLVLG